LSKLPFIPNQIYKRSIIHDQYGGTRQGGIAPSAQFPYIFIFSGSQGKAHGYEDAWDNSQVYTYTGEGQVGDMQFVKGNLALRDHLARGKRVFLFEYVRTAYVRFVTELEVFDFGYFEALDSAKNLRQAIRFFFKRPEATLPKAYQLFDQQTYAAEDLSVYRVPEFTERVSLGKSRIGQDAFRKRIIHRWEYKCAVTGFDKPDILIASHIHPWKHATDHERLDVNNGILLSPTYDALFDTHLISFENTGKIILSDTIESEAYNKIGVTGKEAIKTFHLENLHYLEMHRLNLL
jgi:hypothetical protein